MALSSSCVAALRIAGFIFSSSGVATAESFKYSNGTTTHALQEGGPSPSSLTTSSLATQNDLGDFVAAGLGMSRSTGTAGTESATGGPSLESAQDSDTETDGTATSTTMLMITRTLSNPIPTITMTIPNTSANTTSQESMSRPLSYEGNCWQQWNSYWTANWSLTEMNAKRPTTSSYLVTYTSHSFGDTSTWTELDTQVRTDFQGAFPQTTYTTVVDRVTTSLEAVDVSTWLETRAETRTELPEYSEALITPTCALPTIVPECQKSWDRWADERFEIKDGLARPTYWSDEPLCTQAAVTGSICTGMISEWMHQNSIYNQPMGGVIGGTAVNWTTYVEHSKTVTSRAQSWQSEKEFAPKCTLGCQSCEINGGTVQVIYWPPASSTWINGMYTALPDNSNKTSTIETLGTTLTSPTVYVSFDSLYARDSCSTWGKTHSGSIVAITDTATLSSLWGWGHYNGVGATASFNFTDLYNQPVPESIYLSQPRCASSIAQADFRKGPEKLSLGANWTCPRVTDYDPILSIPAEVVHLDPEWANCKGGFEGVYDPPIALTPKDSIAMPTRPGEDLQPSESAVPASSPKPTAAPATSSPQPETTDRPSGAAASGERSSSPLASTRASEPADSASTDRPVSQSDDSEQEETSRASSAEQSTEGDQKQTSSVPTSTSAVREANEKSSQHESLPTETREQGGSKGASTNESIRQSTEDASETANDQPAKQNPTSRPVSQTTENTSGTATDQSVKQVPTSEPTTGSTEDASETANDQSAKQAPTTEPISQTTENASETGIDQSAKQVPTSEPSRPSTQDASDTAKDQSVQKPSVTDSDEESHTDRPVHPKPSNDALSVLSEAAASAKATKTDESDVASSQPPTSSVQSQGGLTTSDAAHASNSEPSQNPPASTVISLNNGGSATIHKVHSSVVIAQDGLSAGAADGGKATIGTHVYSVASDGTAIVVDEVATHVVPGSAAASSKDAALSGNATETASDHKPEDATQTSSAKEAETKTKTASSQTTTAETDPPNPANPPTTSAAPDTTTIKPPTTAAIWTHSNSALTAIAQNPSSLILQGPETTTTLPAGSAATFAGEEISFPTSGNVVVHGSNTATLKPDSDSHSANDDAEADGAKATTFTQDGRTLVASATDGSVVLEQNSGAVTLGAGEQTVAAGNTLSLGAGGGAVVVNGTDSFSLPVVTMASQTSSRDGRVPVLDSSAVGGATSGATETSEDGGEALNTASGVEGFDSGGERVVGTLGGVVVSVCVVGWFGLWYI